MSPDGDITEEFTFPMNSDGYSEVRKKPILEYYNHQKERTG